MYSRGERVIVEGFQGKRAVLYVWEQKERGLMLCTAEGFGHRMKGVDAPVVGYPMQDIKGLYQDGEEEAQT